MFKLISFLSLSLSLFHQKIICSLCSSTLIQMMRRSHLFLLCPLPTKAHTVVMLLVNSFTIKSKQSLVSLFLKGENLIKNGKTHSKQNTNVTIF